MIQVYPEKTRYKVDLGWLKSRPSFQFGEYVDPDNSAFGVMRVCNDDYIAPGRGFGAHPHSDMEIVTIILSGQIRHEDNLGNIEIASVGEVQRITAGSGVIHAEYNPSDTEGLHLLQLWFMPRERGLPPSYETARYDRAKLVNALLPVAAAVPSEGVVKVEQDMTIYLSRLEAGRELAFRQEAGRRVFLFVIEGSLTVNGVTLGARDEARITDEPELALKAGGEQAFLMLIDLP